jgi:hypothetical protein
MTINYTDGFTLDGRVKPRLGVTKKKVGAVKLLTEATMRGDRIAKGTLEESLTTSDAIFNLAHLVSINTLAQYPEAPRVWNQIATTRIVSDSVRRLSTPSTRSGRIRAFSALAPLAT